MGTETLPYEQAAEKVTNLEGWVCKTCRQFWGKDQHMAQYCCAGDLPCKTEGCDARVKKHSYMYCQPCLDKRDLDRFLSLEEADWDGETPLVGYNDDNFFHDEDSIREQAEEMDVKPWEMRLVVCVKEEPPTFDMYEFLQDYLCEGQEEEANWGVMDKHVNAWIAKNAPTVWAQGKKRISEKSLRAIFAE